MVEAGVDLVELGLPYSDPVMDGPTIQAAADRLWPQASAPPRCSTSLRASVAAGAPTVIMTYWNLVDRYGVERFAADLVEAGGSGLITPDLTPDEAGEWIAASDKHDLDRVFLVAPSSTDERLAHDRRRVQRIHLRRGRHGRHRRPRADQHASGPSWWPARAR